MIGPVAGIMAGLMTTAVLVGCGANAEPAPSPAPSATAAGPLCGVLPVDVVGRLLPGPHQALRAFGRPPKRANAYFDCEVVRHGSPSHSMRARIGDEATMKAIGQGQVVKPAIDKPTKLPADIGEGEFYGRSSWVYSTATSSGSSAR
jgi:hypothetical protein